MTSRKDSEIYIDLLLMSYCWFILENLYCCYQLKKWSLPNIVSTCVNIHITIQVRCTCILLLTYQIMGIFQIIFQWMYCFKTYEQPIHDLHVYWCQWTVIFFIVLSWYKLFKFLALIIVVKFLNKILVQKCFKLVEK